MLYFFKDNFVKLKWHTDSSDGEFMIEIFKKLKNVSYVEISNYHFNIFDFHRSYFADGSYRNDINIEIRIKLSEYAKLVGNTGGEGVFFGNVFICNDIYNITLLDHFLIASAHVQQDSDNIMILATATDFIKIKRSYANFFNNFLKHKKIDSSYFPYDNDKDFLLL